MSDLPFLPAGPERPFRAVVFDFGGVLITPITNLLDEVAQWHDITMVEMLDILLGPRERSTSEHPWHRAERGELPTAAMQAEAIPFAEAAGVTLRGDEYERLLCGVFEVRDDVVALIPELRRAGYVTGLLTNSFVEFRDHLESKVDFSIFDHVIDSSEVGCRKPEPEIYRLVTDACGVPPSEILYFDDFEANLVGARDEGWTTVHVTSADSVPEGLATHLG